MSVSGGLKLLLLPLTVFNHRFTLWARNLAGLMLAIMTVIILTQVFARYVLNDSLGWSEEVSKLMMVCPRSWLPPGLTARGPTFPSRCSSRSFHRACARCWRSC